MDKWIIIRWYPFIIVYYACWSQILGDSWGISTAHNQTVFFLFVSSFGGMKLDEHGDLFANMWTWTPQEEMRGVRSTCWHEHGKSCSSKGAFTKITGRSPFRKGRELHQLEMCNIWRINLGCLDFIHVQEDVFFQEISNSAKHVQVIQWGIFRRIDIDLTWSNILNYILIRNVGWFVTLWNFYMCTGMAL